MGNVEAKATPPVADPPPRDFDGFLFGVQGIGLIWTCFTGGMIGAGAKYPLPTRQGCVGGALFLSGLYLMVPSPVRLMYCPYFWLWPSECLWAALTGAVMGAGWHVLAAGPDALAAPPALEAQVAATPAAEDEEGEGMPMDALVEHMVNGAVAGAIICTGLYLAAPGPLRVAMSMSMDSIDKKK